MQRFMAVKPPRLLRLFIVVIVIIELFHIFLFREIIKPFMDQLRLNVRQ